MKEIKNSIYFFLARPQPEYIMKQIFTEHAIVRKQQRGIPPLIANWLIDYGDEAFDGHGGVVRFFSKNCIRKLERELGRESIKRMSEFLRCYLVQSSRDGVVITVGKRYQNQHIWKH
jgi:hypothetical protein